MYAPAIEKIVTETAGVPSADLAGLAMISDLHAVLADNITDAARLITRIEDELRTKITSVRRDLGTAETALDAGHWINERGIIQNTATEIDMLAARRHDAYAALTGACRAVAALPSRP